MSKVLYNSLSGRNPWSHIFSILLRFLWTFLTFLYLSEKSSFRIKSQSQHFPQINRIKMTIQNTSLSFSAQSPRCVRSPEWQSIDQLSPRQWPRLCRTKSACPCWWSRRSSRGRGSRRQRHKPQKRQTVQN